MLFFWWFSFKEWFGNSNPTKPDYSSNGALDSVRMLNRVTHSSIGVIFHFRLFQVSIIHSGDYRLFWRFFHSSDRSLATCRLRVHRNLALALIIHSLLLIILSSPHLFGHSTDWPSYWEIVSNYLRDENFNFKFKIK